MEALKDAILPTLMRKGILPTVTIHSGGSYAQILFSLEDEEDMGGGDQVIVSLDFEDKYLNVKGVYESQGGAEKDLLSLRIPIVMSQPIARVAVMIANAMTK